MNIIDMYKGYLINNLYKADNTVKGYVGDINHFVAIFPNFRELQKRDIIEYLASLNGKFSTPTIIRKTASIQSFWTFLVNIGEVEKNVTEGLQRPKLKVKEVECPSKDEVLKMISDSKDETLKIAIQLGAFVGLRASEATNLKIEDINFENNTAMLFDTKTAQSAKVAMDTITLRRIKEYCEDRGIFEGEVLRTKHGHPFSERSFSRFIEKNSPINFHQFRKTCASELANSDAGIKSAQDQLRHVSINTTIRYIKKDLNHLHNMLDKMRGE